MVTWRHNSIVTLNVKKRGLESNVVEMVAQGIWFAVFFTVAFSDTVDQMAYLWPMPHSVKWNSDMYSISKDFTFQGTGAGGELPIVTGAFERYRKFVTPSTSIKSTRNVYAMALEKLVVDVATADETLGLETDESCESRVQLVILWMLLWWCLNIQIALSSIQVVPY